MKRAATHLLTAEQAAMLQSREWPLDNLYSIVSEQGISVPFARNDVQHALWDQLCSGTSS